MTGPWLLHGVIWAATSPPPAAKPHARVRHGDLCLVVTPSRLDGSPEGDTAELLRHDSLLAAYASEADVAPIRFGAAAAGPEAARAGLARRAEALRNALERLEGAAEFSFRIVEDGPPAAPPPPADPQNDDGRDWLRRRAALRRGAAEQDAARRAFIEAAARRIIGMAREATLRRPTTGRTTARRRLDLALLAARDAASALETERGRLAAEARPLGLSVTLTGPWAPYAFADLQEIEA